MNKKTLSERMALMLTLILIATIMSASIVLAGDKGSLAMEKTIDINDLTTWQDVANITDTTGDNLNQTVTNATDITNVWVCNNYTCLFVRVDVAESLPTTPQFAILFYIEDANQTLNGNETLLYTNEEMVSNDINATFLFLGTNETLARYNFTDTEWTLNQNLTDPATQGAFNWTENSYVMMIQLNLTSSNGEVFTDDSFKFEIYTAFSEDGTTWFATDYLDYATYTVTGSVIPEFPNLALMLLLVLIASSSIIATKKLKLLH